MNLYRTKTSTYTFEDPWGILVDQPVTEILEMLTVERTADTFEYTEYYTDKKRQADIWVSEDGRRFWGRPPTDFHGHTIYTELDNNDPEIGFWRSAGPMSRSIYQGEPFFTDEYREWIKRDNEKKQQEIATKLREAEAVIAKYGKQNVIVL